MGGKRNGGRLDPPHPRQEPRIPLPLTAESLERTFRDCADFSRREIALAGDDERRVELFFLSGMVRMERVNDYILRPMAQDAGLKDCRDMAAVRAHMAAGALYSLSAAPVDTMDAAAAALVSGSCLILFPGEGEALAVDAGTEEKRSISPPENETAVKGARESFVESLRTNTSLVRRHLKAPELRIKEQIVGRQSLTGVDILYIEGIANPETVERADERLRDIDIDAVLAAGNIEEYIVDRLDTPFPLMRCTERPDRFCTGLAEGRVGILVDGLPLGYLVPGTADAFFRSEQDRAGSWMLASVLTLLRYLCALITLLLPAFYIAVVAFHQEMIPTRLALSIIAAKRDVPFASVFEMLVMLLAFEILQEAGARLPASIGQTVSIIGGLVVGQAAVEAKIVSPAVLIAAAIAGVAGYTTPSQEMAGALRIWRFLLTVLAGAAGLFGMAMGLAGLIWHLAGLESFGVAYLAPFSGGERGEARRAVLREPLPWTKLRPAQLRTKNRRNQR